MPSHKSLVSHPPYLSNCNQLILAFGLRTAGRRGESVALWTACSPSPFLSRREARPLEDLERACSLFRLIEIPWLKCGKAQGTVWFRKSGVIAAKFDESSEQLENVRQEIGVAAPGDACRRASLFFRGPQRPGTTASCGCGDNRDP